MNDREELGKQLDDVLKTMRGMTTVMGALVAATVLLAFAWLSREPSEVHGGSVKINHAYANTILDHARARGFYTTRDLAELGGVTTDTVRERIHRGEYPGATQDNTGRWRVPFNP